MHAPAERVANLLRRYGLDARNEVIDIGKRQTVEADHGQVLGDFLIAVDAQREAAGDILLRRHQFLWRRPLLGELLQYAAHHGKRFGTLAVLGLQPEQERTRLAQWHEVAVHAV